ncbi:MAG: 3-hydroxyisobutyrate dehydrogenase [Legionellaceae bacterium]|nr:3-hydroxyisobutyrate dehydrogenase [Legionellaceae bacterium]
MMHIGFVGLGHMGLPMALRLLQAGHSVLAYDVNPTALTAWADAGGKIATDLPTLASASEAILTMLQTGTQIRDVCLGPNGLFQHAAANTLYINCSTIDVDTARAIHDLALDHGLLSLDAPVSGGVAGAEAGTLTFMVGGDKTVFEQAQPLFAHMGKQVIYVGAAGLGQAAKTCNNLVLGISMIAVSEAFLLAQSLGLSAEIFYEVISQASGRCWVTERYLPVPDVLPNVPANHAYAPGFSAQMMLKDLRLSQESASTQKMNTPMAALATHLYTEMVAAGDGNLDFSAIIQYLNG